MSAKRSRASYSGAFARRQASKANASAASTSIE